MKTIHTITAICFFGSGMFLLGYITPFSQGIGWIALVLTTIIGMITFIGGFIE